MPLRQRNICGTMKTRHPAIATKVKDSPMILVLSNTDCPDKVGIKSFKAASIICRDYIERNELGGGNWSGGQIYHDSELVAEVGYNGAVWNSDGQEIDV
jgi:hypothetical protein